MGSDSPVHGRRSIRLRHYDYAQPGGYSVTITLQRKHRLFGNIVDGRVSASAAGEMVAEWWSRLPAKFPTVSLDAFVVMPDHIHGIIIINAPHGRNASTGDKSTDAPARAAVSLGKIIQWFKTMTTNAYMHGVRNQGWPAFDRRLWHRNYYEHVIRDTADLQRIQAYIETNPARWNSNPSETTQ